MRLFRRIAWIALFSGVLSFLVVPFLIPESSTGTKTYVEAAGEGAEFVELNELQVHVERVPYSGDCECESPLIVLMHGFGASTFSWREVIQPFSKFGDVIAYDRPGFGFTERPTSWGEINPYGFEGNFALLDELISKFGADRKVVLVGHSAGGQLAAEYARLNPSKVSGLILVDPAILTTGGGPSGFDWFYQIPQIQRLGPVLVSSIASSGDELLRQSFFDKNILTAEIYDGYHQPLKVKGWEQAFWNFATAPRENSLSENLSELTLPVLLITGDSDTVVPTADTEKLATLIPNSVLSIIAESGHLPHEEQPEAFMAKVAGFLSAP